MRCWSLVDWPLYPGLSAHYAGVRVGAQCGPRYCIVALRPETNPCGVVRGWFCQRSPKPRRWLRPFWPRPIGGAACCAQARRHPGQCLRRLGRWALWPNPDQALRLAFSRAKDRYLVQLESPRWRQPSLARHCSLPVRHAASGSRLASRPHATARTSPLPRRRSSPIQNFPARSSPPPPRSRRLAARRCL